MKQIELTANGVTAKLTLRTATIGDNMRKSRLASQAFANPLADSDEQTVAAVIYPRCMGCLVMGEVDGQDAKNMTPAEFVDLPGEIGEAWLTAVLKLNPAWDLTPPSDAEQASAEKKD